MPANQDQRQNRGHLLEGIESQFDSLSFDEKVKLLKSRIATERTMGARALTHHQTQETVEHLIKALRVEKKLYSKIEICNTLVKLNEMAIQPLIKCLGSIGDNQHQTVPDKEFLKDSYPLPRDIASRTLIRIGPKAIPELLLELETASIPVLSETIDTIGHINFNSKVESLYEKLKSCFDHYPDEDLIQWKIIRAFSGINESEEFLKKLSIEIKNDRLKKEIKRSLHILARRKKSH